MNIVELYDEFSISGHENHQLIHVSTSLSFNCLLEMIIFCRDHFQTVNCNLKFKCGKSRRANYRNIEYPIMIGSVLASSLDHAFHNGTDDVKRYFCEPSRDCLKILSNVKGVFIINGIPKYLPTHLYFRNKTIHINNQRQCIFYHYHNKKKEAKKSKSDKVIYENEKFYENGIEISESDLVENIKSGNSLRLGTDYQSPYPEGMVHWLKNVPYYDFDNLRHKTFFPPGYVLWLLRDFALKSKVSNANAIFKKGINSGNIKFLFSATAKFIPNLARETSNTPGNTDNTINNLFKDLNILNPQYTRTITQVIQKVNSGYACNNQVRRLIHESEYMFLCPFSSTDGHKIGLTLDIADGCELSGFYNNNIHWSELIRTISQIVNEVSIDSHSNNFFYVFLNSVPVLKIESDNHQRDILNLYYILRVELKTRYKFVEFRHDNYISLFINIIPGLIVREGVTPAEHMDFNTKFESNFGYGINVRHLKYFQHNPANKIVFFLHALRCVIQKKREDLKFLNFSDYPYLLDAETTNTGLDGFFLDTIYLPYFDQTAEDALVISRSAAKRFSYIYLEQIRIYANDPTPSNQPPEPLVLIEEGSFISIDQVIAAFPTDSKLKINRRCYVGKQTNEHIWIQSNRVGKVKRIRQNVFNNTLNFIIIIENKRKLQVGDKICSISGQKSVVSRIIPDDKLPKRKSDGKVPDVIASAESFSTRFTLGQIHEALDLGGRDVYLLGYDKPVFWGKVFYCLLNHFVNEKFFSFKNKLNINHLTHQAVRGRSKWGGLRMSISELSALAGYGVSEIIYSKFIKECDGEILFLCDEHGCLHCAKGPSKLLGHHALCSGTFGTYSFSSKRTMEDYAVSAIDLKICKKRRFF